MIRLTAAALILLALLISACASAPSPAAHLPVILGGLPQRQETPVSGSALYGAGMPSASATPFRPLLDAAFSDPAPAHSPASADVPLELVVPTPVPEFNQAGTINLLLVGVDSNSGRAFRTDALILAIFRPAVDSISLITIPRDLYVYIPAKGMNRINTAYLYGELEGYRGGGSSSLKDTILYNLGLRIDHLVLMDFDGFRQIVNMLGGIDLPVICAYTDWHLIDPEQSDQLESNWDLITIGPGPVHMDGDLALWYARSRLRSSDFDRGRRQQEILRALFERGLRWDIMTNVPEIYNRVSASVTTDITLEDVVRLAPLVRGLNTAHIRSYYINNQVVTNYSTSSGAKVLLPEPEKIRKLIQTALAPLDEAGQENVKIGVDVWNAGAPPGSEDLAGERLNYAGFHANPKSGDVLKTGLEVEPAVTLLFDHTIKQDSETSARLLAALGLPVSSLRSAPDANSTALYRLVLGSDYDPCFDPVKLSH